MTAEEVRAVIESADPALLRLADALKAKCDAKMIYLKAGSVQLGNQKYLISQPYNARLRRRAA